MADCNTWQTRLKKKSSISVICSILRRASHTDWIAKALHNVSPVYMAKLRHKAVALLPALLQVMKGPVKTQTSLSDCLFCDSLLCAVCKGTQLSLPQPSKSVRSGITQSPNTKSREHVACSHEPRFTPC